MFSSKKSESQFCVPYIRAYDTFPYVDRHMRACKYQDNIPLVSKITPFYYSTITPFYHMWSRERAKYETVLHCSVVLFRFDRFRTEQIRTERQFFNEKKMSFCLYNQMVNVKVKVHLI